MNNLSIQELVKSAETIKFIGEALLQSNTVLGHEAGKHWDAIQFVHNMFTQIDADIKAHPDYETLLAAKKAEAAV